MFDSFRASMTGLAGGGGKAGALVDRATAELLLGADYGLNMEVVHCVKAEPSTNGRDAARALRRKVGQRNPKVCNLALKLLETCMLNCGMTFHQVVVETGLLTDLVALTDTKRKLDRDLRNKILQQLETWGTGISIPLEFQAEYTKLRKAGILFPPKDPNAPSFGGGGAAPAFSPPGGGGGMRPLGEPSPAPAAAAGGGLGLGLDGEIQTQAQVAHQAREERKKIPLPQILDIAENSVSLLEDLLGSLTGDDPTAVKDDVITQLADACKRASRPIREAIETSTDEEVVTRALQVYERIAKQMDKYDGLLAVYYSAREKMIAEAFGLDPVVPRGAQAAASAAAAAAPPVAGGRAASGSISETMASMGQRLSNATAGLFAGRNSYSAVNTGEAAYQGTGLTTPGRGPGGAGGAGGYTPPSLVVDPEPSPAPAGAYQPPAAPEPPAAAAAAYQPPAMDSLLGDLSAQAPAPAPAPAPMGSNADDPFAGSGLDQLTLLDASSPPQVAPAAPAARPAPTSNAAPGEANLLGL